MFKIKTLKSSKSFIRLTRICKEIPIEIINNIFIKLKKSILDIAIAMARGPSTAGKVFNLNATII